MAIADVLTSLGEGIAKMMASVLNTLSTVFFTVGEGGAITITAVGYIALISLVLGIVYFLFRWITSLVKGRR